MNKLERQETYEQESCLLESMIRTVQADMRLLVDFYVGERTLAKPTLPRSEIDDKRFLSTLRNLRERLEKLQKQYVTLEQERRQ